MSVMSFASAFALRRCQSGTAISCCKRFIVGATTPLRENDKCNRSGDSSTPSKKSRIALLAEDIDYVRDARTRDIRNSRTMRQKTLNTSHGEGDAGRSSAIGTLATDAIAQMAESQIRKALHDGALQGLQGEGKPLPENRAASATHFGGVEQAEILAVMHRQGVKPPSLEYLQELSLQAAQLRKCLSTAIHEQIHGTQANKGVGGHREDGLCDTAEALMAVVMSASGGRRVSLGALFRELNNTVTKYNSAVVKDQLIFRSLPVKQRSFYVWDALVVEARHAVEAGAPEMAAFGAARFEG
eukprot:m.604941 g.604941  ORF g.604941 m.604941 type:complete len:299 (+) comp22463_c0_seq3:154-1050(+)